MRVGITRAQTYQPAASRFQVIPSALGQKPAEEAASSRQAVLQRAARPLVNLVPDDGLRGSRVGQIVMNRTLSAQPEGVAAYRRQEEQMSAWRRWMPEERSRSAVRAEVSSALGGAVQSAGAFLDQRV